MQPILLFFFLLFWNRSPFLDLTFLLYPEQMISAGYSQVSVSFYMFSLICDLALHSHNHKGKEKLVLVTITNSEGKFV